MRCGCVDIGSNTTRLLVADAGPEGVREVAWDKAYTRAEGLADIVARQLAVARSHGAERVRVVATAGVRDAPELAAGVEAFCGVPVDVLTGEEEAALAFAGAVRCHPERLDGTIAVVDVGGGSTEIAIGGRDGVRWWVSLPVGSRHPARVGDIAALRPPPVDVALAVGGSATSTKRLAGPRIDAASARDALRAVRDGGRHGLDPERLALMPAGLAILTAVSELLGRPLEIGGGGLREGVVLQLAGTGAPG